MAASLVAACGGTATAVPGSGDPGSVSSQGPAVSPTATGLRSAGASVASPAASPAIAIDPALLQVLPARLDGLDRQRDASIDAGAFADPTLPGIATAGATALYIDPSAVQFAYVAVVRLAAGGLTDAQFRAWRDTFDKGACAQAGGVVGNAQATIGGHVTYIGSCTGGLKTYHTILAGPGLLVSVSSVGDRRLGEQLVSALPR